MFTRFLLQSCRVTRRSGKLDDNMKKFLGAEPRAYKRRYAVHRILPLFLLASSPVYAESIWPFLAHLKETRATSSSLDFQEFLRRKIKQLCIQHPKAVECTEVGQKDIFDRQLSRMKETEQESALKDGDFRASFAVCRMGAPPVLEMGDLEELGEMKPSGVLDRLLGAPSIPPPIVAPGKAEISLKPKSLVESLKGILTPKLRVQGIGQLEFLRRGDLIVYHSPDRLGIAHIAVVTEDINSEGMLQITHMRGPRYRRLHNRDNVDDRLPVEEFLGKTVSLFHFEDRATGQEIANSVRRPPPLMYSKIKALRSILLAGATSESTKESLLTDLLLSRIYPEPALVPNGFQSSEGGEMCASMVSKAIQLGALLRKFKSFSKAQGAQDGKAPGAQDGKAPGGQEVWKEIDTLQVLKNENSLTRERLLESARRLLKSKATRDFFELDTSPLFQWDPTKLMPNTLIRFMSRL